MGVDHSGDGVVIHVALARDQSLDTRHPLFLRFVGQHRAGNHIPQGINPVGVGRKVFVHRNESLSVKLNVGVLESQMIGIRHPPHRQQHPVTNNRVLPFDFDPALPSFNSGGNDLAFEPEFQALLFKNLFRLGGNLGIDAK